MFTVIEHFVAMLNVVMLNVVAPSYYEGQEKQISVNVLF